jgi:uncharacterized protein
MPGENVALIQRLYEAFAAGDVGGVLGAFSADIVWNEAEGFPYSDRNPYQGPAAVAEGVFGRIMSDWEGFAVVPEELLDAGDTVVALGRYFGTSRKTGQSLRAQHVHVWRIADGKVTGFQQYVDTLQVARVTGAV